MSKMAYEMNNIVNSLFFLFVLFAFYFYIRKYVVSNNFRNLMYILHFHLALFFPLGCSSIPSSLSTSNQPNGESMQFVTIPEHITSNPKLKDALSEIMNTDFETLLIIAQLLQKCIEVNYKRLELKCGTTTENMHSVLNKYINSCTSSIETLKQNSLTDGILHRHNSLEDPISSISVTEGTKHISVPNETDGFTPKGPGSSWIPHNAVSW